MNKIIVMFLKQNFFNFKWDKSTGTQISTKLHYSSSGKYRAEKHDFNTERNILYNENTMYIAKILPRRASNVV